MSIDPQAKGNFLKGRDLVYETYKSWSSEGKDLRALKESYDASKPLDEILKTSLPILLANKDTEENRDHVTAFLTSKYNKTQEDKSDPKKDRLEKLFNKIENQTFCSSIEKGRNVVYKVYKKLCDEGGNLSVYKKAYQSGDTLNAVILSAGRFVKEKSNPNRTHVVDFLTAKFNKTQDDINEPKKDRLTRLFEKLSEKDTFLSIAQKKKKHEKKEPQIDAPKSPDTHDLQANNLKKEVENELQAGDPSLKIKELGEQLRELQEEKRKLVEERKNILSNNFPAYSDFRFNDWIDRLTLSNPIDGESIKLKNKLIHTLTALLSNRPELHEQISYQKFVDFIDPKIANLITIPTDIDQKYFEETTVQELKGFFDEIEKIKDLLQKNERKTEELNKNIVNKLDELGIYHPPVEMPPVEQPETVLLPIQQPIKLEDLQKALNNFNVNSKAPISTQENPLPMSPEQLEIEALIRAEQDALKANSSGTQKTAFNHESEIADGEFEGISKDELSPEYQAALFAQTQKTDTSGNVNASSVKKSDEVKNTDTESKQTEGNEKTSGFKSFLRKLTLPFVAIGKFFANLFQSIKNLFAPKKEESKA